MSLSSEDRIRLAEKLLETIECDGMNDAKATELHPAWEAEIRRRIAEIDAGTAVMVPWAEVDRKAQVILDRAANCQVSG